MIGSLVSYIMKPRWLHAAKHWSGGGLESGADVTVVKKHLRWYEKRGDWASYGALNVAATGAAWPRGRCHESGMLGGPRCERCGAPTEDSVHTIWECEANNSIEDKIMDATKGLQKVALKHARATPCLWTRGIIPEELVKVEPPPTHTETIMVGDPLEWQFDGMRIIFLDGSGGKHSSDSRLRRCGWGVAVMNFDDPTNPQLTVGACGGLAGSPQTAPRAEIVAAAMGLQLQAPGGGVVLVSDNKAFVDGSRKKKEHTLAGGNGDVWQLYWEQVEKHGGRVMVVKTKSHESSLALWSGFQPLWMYAGNAFADRLANRGAEAIQLSSGEITNVQAQRGRAWKIQARIAAVYKAIGESSKQARPMGANDGQVDLDDADEVRPAQATRERVQRPSILQLAENSKHRVVVGKGRWSCSRCAQHCKGRGLRTWLASTCVPLAARRAMAAYLRLPKTSNSVELGNDEHASSSAGSATAVAPQDVSGRRSFLGETSHVPFGINHDEPALAQIWPNDEDEDVFGHVNLGFDDAGDGGGIFLGSTRTQDELTAEEQPSEDADRSLGGQPHAAQAEMAGFVPRRDVRIGRRLAHPSHTIYFKRGIFVCLRCAAYAILKGVRLLQPCPGQASTGAYMLDRIARGLTPWPKLQWPLADSQAASEGILACSADLELQLR